MNFNKYISKYNQHLENVKNQKKYWWGNVRGHLLYRANMPRYNNSTFIINISSK